MKAPKSGNSVAAVLRSVPLLLTEAPEQFDVLESALTRRIEPQDIFDQILTNDIAYQVWEQLRLRRAKASLVNARFYDALENLVRRLLPARGGMSYQKISNEADRLAHEWFTRRESKKEIRQLLNNFGLDETAVAGEAIRLTASLLDQLDKLLASSEARRNKNLQLLNDLRLSRSCLENDRVIDQKPPPDQSVPVVNSGMCSDRADAATSIIDATTSLVPSSQLQSTED